MPGSKHEKIVASIVDVVFGGTADTRGTKNLNLGEDIMPDAAGLVIGDKNHPTRFVVADAKKSDNETVDTIATQDRIKSYVDSLVKYILKNPLLHGEILIATDKKDEADKWLVFITEYIRGKYIFIDGYKLEIVLFESGILCEYVFYATVRFTLHKTKLLQYMEKLKKEHRI
mgnify:CR=1 FL=1|jgi:hypothetical protein|nr:MAG TPA: hypothetical protein [Caudoviricetes sp.]